MKSIGKPALWAGVTVAALSLSSCGGGAASSASGEIMKLSLNQAESHPSYIALDNFGECLQGETGDWGIDVYPSATIGNQPESMQLMMDGSIEMVIVSGSYLESLNEDFVVFNLPTVFDDVEHQMEVLHDPAITGELYSSLEDDHNLRVLGGFTQGARSIFTVDGPVEFPEDMAGQKLRVQESEVNIAMAEALGATASPMATSELYTGLQSGVVDAAENNEPFYVSQALHEVAPHWSYTNHLVGVDYLVANTQTLESMDEQEREAFDSCWTAAHEEHTDMWADATEEAIVTAESEGAEFHEVDEAAFDEALSEMAQDFITTESQEALYESVRGVAE